MKKFAGRGRDIVVGLVILVVLAGGFFWYKNRKPALKVPANSEPSITQVEQKLQGKFKFSVPDNVEKTALKDVSGGDGSGIATRTEVLVDLPDPEPGTFYQAWLENNGKLISLGMLRMEKGGWLIEYNGANYPGYNKVVVSQEKVFDSKIEERVLEGSF